MSVTIPLPLRTALESGNCVLFLGAGMGFHMQGKSGVNLPMGYELAQELSVHLAIDPAIADLSKASQIYETRKSRDALTDFLKKRLAEADPDDSFGWLTTLRWKAIYTTNYDRGIERAYEKNDHPPQIPITISSSNQIREYDPRLQVPIYHLHGALFGEATEIVITRADYSRFRERRRMLFEQLKSHFATSVILYIGYSNNDPNWELVLEEVTGEFQPSTPPQSYRVAPTDPIDAEILRGRNVYTIDCDFGAFAATAQALLSDEPVDAARLDALGSLVPSGLEEAFRDNPAAIARLLASWEYVNQASFDQSPNVEDFLRGDRPNWGLIGQKHFMKRDVEDYIFDDILDFATSSEPELSSSIVLGSAGYGTTSLLMAVSARYAADNAGPVFYHRPKTPLAEGDIAFAASIFPQPALIVIDDAGDNLESIERSIQSLRDNCLSAYVLLGSRRNEWPAGRSRVRTKPFHIESLSDSEIYSLIDLLSNHHALNKLDGLDRELQFSEIKSRHSKELLVALREATEGRGFDAIIEDEFRSIPSDFARNVYLAVCCFNQHGAYVRDSLLASLSKTSHEDLYAQLGSDLDGVIHFDCVNEARGTYAARARHRVIANIVWERCGTQQIKDSLIQKSLDSLNLAYGVDASAFESMVRSDKVVDSISTPEGRIKFFDYAVMKDPLNPYVHQHYARMLLRANMLLLAADKIEAGLKVTSNPPRVLYHSKALILSRLSEATESIDIARKKLAQAEGVFTQSIRTSEKDSYAYQGLASLYLMWARRTDGDESAHYVAKAEEVISNGLKKTRDREGLLIVSAEVEAWLGDEPSRILALRRAVKESPGTVVSRYLLARALRKGGSAEEAREVLEPVLKSYPDEYRSFLEAALCLVDLGKPTEAIQALGLSTLYGHSDARYIATHGGLLFMAGKYEEAKRVFEMTKRRDYSPEVLRSVYFRPTTGESGVHIPVQLHGRIVRVEVGYSFIEVAGMPHFYISASKYAGVVLTSGLSVKFEPVFTARGQMASGVQTS